MKKNTQEKQPSSLLIDGSNLVIKYAHSNFLKKLATSKGEQTGLLYSVLNHIIKAIQKETDVYVSICFGSSIYGVVKNSPSVAVQMDVLQSSCSIFGVNFLDSLSYETRDVLYSACLLSNEVIPRSDSKEHSQAVNEAIETYLDPTKHLYHALIGSFGGVPVFEKKVALTLAKEYETMERFLFSENADAAIIQVQQNYRDYSARFILPHLNLQAFAPQVDLVFGFLKSYEMKGTWKNFCKLMDVKEDRFRWSS